MHSSSVHFHCRQETLSPLAIMVPTADTLHMQHSHQVGQSRQLLPVTPSCIKHKLSRVYATDCCMALPKAVHVLLCRLQLHLQFPASRRIKWLQASQMAMSASLQAP